MADFKQQNLTWTLLIDVDEYILFNRMREDDPEPPLDWAPEGVPVLSNWIRKDQGALRDEKTHEVAISGEYTLFWQNCHRQAFLYTSNL